MKKRGFTLIEMLIVIVIIGILAGALIPRIGNARDKAQDVAKQANVNALTSAGMQALIDSKTPCNDDNGVDYTDLANYGITTMGTGYYCKVYLTDHLVVWTDSIKVAENNNCSQDDIDALTASSDLTAVLNVVGKTKSLKSSEKGRYCLAQ